MIENGKGIATSDYVDGPARKEARVPVLDFSLDHGLRSTGPSTRVDEDDAIKSAPANSLADCEGCPVFPVQAEGLDVLLGKIYGTGDDGVESWH
jgi:hypothetical protein